MWPLQHILDPANLQVAYTYESPRSRFATAGKLKGGLFCPSNNLILNLRSQLDEMSAETSHSHYQISIILGVFLGVQERFSANHIELDMIFVEVKISFY